MLQPRDSVHGVYFNIEKEESGVWLSTKNMFFFEITEGRRYKAFVLLKCVHTFVHDCRDTEAISIISSFIQMFKWPGSGISEEVFYV